MSAKSMTLILVCLTADLSETIDDLNRMILKITMKIKDEHPELSKYLEEMTITIPNSTHPEITRKILHDYYNSLQAMLNKYIQATA